MIASPGSNTHLAKARRISNNKTNSILSGPWLCDVAGCSPTCFGHSELLVARHSCFLGMITETAYSRLNRRADEGLLEIAMAVAEMYFTQRPKCRG